MIEQFRTIIEDNLEWRWSYALQEETNLEEAASEDDETPLFHLDPVFRNWEYSSLGLKTGWQIVSGGFLILLKSGSSIDEVRDSQLGNNPDNGKWRLRIRPAIESVDGNTSLLDQFLNEITCDNSMELMIQSLNIAEVVNLFDDNLDGVSVKFKFKLRL